MSRSLVRARHKRWLMGYYGGAVGLTIKSVKTSVDAYDDSTWVVLVAQDKAGNTYELTLSSDEEGNAPGFLFGLPVYTLPDTDSATSATE